MIQIKKFRLELVKESNFRYDVDDKKANSPDSVYKIGEMIFNFSSQAEEIFAILCLDTKNNVTGAFEVSRGTLNSSIVHPREVFKRAILNNAASIILLHNHPSGEPRPSHEDIRMTNRLDECGKLLGITVIDHVIYGDSFYSFKEEGLL
jgi:DNA repair protein RadC